jgi:hypothetical protein
MKKGRINMKYVITAILFAIMTTGCVMTEMLVPNVDTRMKSDELAHLKTVNEDYNESVLKLIKENNLENDNSKIKVANIMLKATRDASDIKPSETGTLANNYMRMVGRERLDEQIGTGIEWSTKLIGEVAGGGVATTGGIGYILALLRRKNRALRVVNSELDETAKARVKKALEHTGSEKEVT